MGAGLAFVVLDTEYTAWEGSMARGWSEPWEHREIVQIGALSCLLTLEGGDHTRSPIEVGERFEVLVRPRLNPQLSAYFVELTGITQARLEREGMAFERAVRALARFVAARPVACWGRDDVVLEDNCRLHGLSEAESPPMFDVREVFAAAGVDTDGISSGRIGAELGSELVLRAHDALQDCLSIVEGLRRLERTPLKRRLERLRDDR